MFPRIIFQTWKEKSIPAQYQEWVESWKEKNPGYEYRLYDDHDNEQFVKKEFPQYYSLYQSFPAEIYRCDVVRYLYLYKHGGIYADLDFECLKGFEELLIERRRKRILVGKINTKSDKKYKGYKIPNALMISYPREKFWIDLVEQIKQKRGDERNKPPDEVTGPWALEKSISKYEEIQILDPWYFYCISPFDNYLSYIIDKGETLKDNKKEFSLGIKKIKRIEALYKKSYAITYWTHSWKDWRESIKTSRS